VIEKKLLKEEEEKADVRGVLIEFQSSRRFEEDEAIRGVEVFLSSNNSGVIFV